MPPIPPFLIVLTVVLVVLPSLVAIYLRFSLYHHLVFLEKRVRRLINRQNRGEQPKVVTELETRFKEASSSLEKVNTAALIDQVYSREKVGFFHCEQIDYFCRTLPNLLIAFGLLGTFFGITNNLSELSQTINQTTASNVSNLVAELQKPLEGMSIAFTTSLTGIFFSALLIVVNLIKNTNIAKYRLISCLEDYLDNIYQPEVQGDTRLDKIVNRMVFQQETFLTNFGDTVRQAVEQSLGRVAAQIAEGNKEATDLAKQVYQRFTESSGTISAAATEFKFATEQLKTNVEIFKQAAQIFDRSQFPQRLLEATADLASTQQYFSQSSASLAQTVTSIATAVSEVQRCSQALFNLGEEIKNVNQTSISVLKLHQTNQNSLREIIPQLQQGADGFSKAIDRLDNLEQRIVNKADSLNDLVEYAEQLSVKLDTFKLDLTHLVQNYNVVSEDLLEGVSRQTVTLQECVQHLNDTKDEIYKLRLGLEKEQ